MRAQFVTRATLHYLTCKWNVFVSVAVAAASGCNSASKSKAESAPPAVLAEMPADPREPALAALVDRLLSTQHLQRRPVDDGISKAAFSEFLKRLDPGKMFLLQSDVDKLRKYHSEMDDQLKSGRLVLAQMGAGLFAKRLAVVQDLVAQRLKKPFDFGRDESVETDADKQQFAATDQALAERWRKTLKLDVLGRVVRMQDRAEHLASGKPDDSPHSVDAGVPQKAIPKTEEAREALARSELAKRYAARFARLGDDEPLDAAGTFVNAIASVYGPHTVYMAPITRDNFDIQMSGSLEGIGAVLSEDDHYIRVVRIVPGGASWRQGQLAAGDMILSVAQQGEEAVDVADMRINKVVKMIRGAKGTVVTLTVQKSDKTIESIAITRDVVEIEAAYARGALIKVPGAKPMGYVYLPSFYGNTRSRRGKTPERRCTDDVRKILAIFAKRGVTGAIIDVRGNGGGLLDDARDITGLFIKTGPVVQTRHSSGKVEVLRDSDPEVVFPGKVVVLVDRFSASASEILAAALQDYGRAVIVGTGPTHGKGTVQAMIDLDGVSQSKSGKSLGVFKLTIQQFFRILGGSTQLRGVTPDIVLPDPIAHVESGERHLDHAIEWSETKPVEFDAWPRPPGRLEQWKANSTARVAKSDYFASVTKRVTLLKARRDQTVVPLAKAKWIAQRNEQRDALKKVTIDLSKTKGKFRVTSVDYDGKVAASPRVRNGKRVKSDVERWRENIARDPWLFEALNVLGDMVK